MAKVNKATQDIEDVEVTRVEVELVGKEVFSVTEFSQATSPMAQIPSKTSSLRAETKLVASLSIVDVTIMPSHDAVDIPLSRSFIVGKENKENDLVDLSVEESSKEEEEEPCMLTLDLNLAYAHGKATTLKSYIQARNVELGYGKKSALVEMITTLQSSLFQLCDPTTSYDLLDKSPEDLISKDELTHIVELKTYVFKLERVCKRAKVYALTSNEKCLERLGGIDTSYFWKFKYSDISSLEHMRVEETHEDLKGPSHVLGLKSCKLKRLGRTEDIHPVY
ncbi:hypothetical protein ACFE04_002117 [Oxalis oulophora]